MIQRTDSRITINLKSPGTIKIVIAEKYTCPRAHASRNVRGPTTTTHCAQAVGAG